MSKPQPTNRDADFLYEMGSIRFIRRMWTRFLGGNFANLAEHHFRVFWIAMMIAERESQNQPVDTGKVAKLVMVHDIAESRTGDVDYLARQYVTRNDELGIHDMLGDTSLEKEFLELWEEYEKRESIESKIVKDADNIDVDMELVEQAAAGNQLRDIWLDKRQIVEDTKMYTDSAKALIAEVKAANPHNWHLTGRNRISHGDWKTDDAT